MKGSNTGFRGIHLHKNSNKFEIRVNVKDNTKITSFYLGSHPTLEGAVKLRQKFITNLL